MIAFVLILYGLLAWSRPRLAIGVLLFLIPFGHLVRFSIAGVPFTFPEAAAYMLAFVCAAHSRKPIAGSQHRRLLSAMGYRLSAARHDPWVILPLLWIIIAAVSAAYSPNALRAWGIWKAYFLGPVLLFWIIRWLFSWPTQDAFIPPASFRASSEKSHMGASPSNDVRSLGSGLGMMSGVVLPLALGAVLVAAIAIAQRWWPIGVPYPWSLPGKFRATSVFGYPNAVGLYLAPLVPLFVGMAFSCFRSLRGAARRSNPESVQSHGIATLAYSSLAMTIWWVAVAALSLLAIILAKSTGALVALAAAIPTYVVLARWSRPRRRPRAAALAILGAWVAMSLVCTAWLPYQGEHRWGSPFVQKLTFQKWSGSVRLAQYRETWQLFRDHPIRGAGLAGYQQAIALYHEDARVEIFLYPHNLLLAVWVELGLAGVLVFLAILYQFFRAVSSIQYSVFSIAMVVILVHGLVDVPYFKNDLAMVFWVIVAIGTIPAALGTMASYGRSVASSIHSSTPSDR